MSVSRTVLSAVIVVASLAPTPPGSAFIQDAPELPPPVIALCNAGFGDYRISTYSSSPFGDIDLRCGDWRDGYVHTRKRHERDWQRIIDLAGGGGTWDDLMDFVTRQAIEAPSPGYPIDQENGKTCYTTPVEIVRADGTIIRTLMPTVIVSIDNTKVITTYPTTGSPDC